MVQRRVASVEASIWIASYLLAIVGLVKAVYSEQPLLWLAVWPAPIALASTIFIFVRQGFHFQNGVLVLGRRHTFAALLPDQVVSRIGEKKTKMTTYYGRKRSIRYWLAAAALLCFVLVSLFFTTVAPPKNASPNPERAQEVQPVDRSL